MDTIGDMAVKVEQSRTADLESTRVRGMREVADEARAREATAVRGGRVADAALYREIAERAEAVTARERKIGYFEDLRLADADRNRYRDERQQKQIQTIERSLCGGLLLIVLLGAVVLFSGCSRPASTPGDRPATVAEASAAPLVFEARYAPPFSADFWRTWRGAATVELGRPELGLGELPAEAQLGDGFEGLDDCLKPELDGTWTLAASVLSVDLADGTGTSFHLAGTLVARSVRVPGGPTDYTFETRIVGSGTWTAAPGPGCGPEDFANGTTGVWSCVQEDVAGLRADHGLGRGTRRARALLLGGDGSLTEVVGPREAVVGLALRTVSP